MADGALVAASLTGLAGIITAWAAIIRAKKQGTAECEKELAEARGEAETLAQQLHEIKMSHPDWGAIKADALMIMALVFITTSVLLFTLAGYSKATGKQGPPGIPGPPGSNGKQGPPGSNGSTGSTGAKGSKGDKGDKGAPATNQSITGSNGATGSNGKQGPQGIPGPKGNTGPPGPQGNTGPPGSNGAPGPAGKAGSFACPAGSSLRELSIKTKNQTSVIWACVIN